MNLTLKYSYSQYMIYQNAPIREALFNIRVDLTNIVQTEDLYAFKEHAMAYFPIEKKKYRAQIQVNTEANAVSESQTNLDGYVFISEDQTRLLQVGMDGLTLNVLKPYENWDTHFAQFIEMWEMYNQLFAPKNVNKITTRFINKIDIPLNDFKAFQDYIVNMPPIPTCLPQTFEAFFMQIQVPYPGNVKKAIITETIEPVSNSILPFILDIELFREERIDNSIESLTSAFNELRILKNEIFQDCLTSKAKALFL